MRRVTRLYTAKLQGDEISSAYVNRLENLSTFSVNEFKSSNYYSANISRPNKKTPNLELKEIEQSCTDRANDLEVSGKMVGKVVSSIYSASLAEKIILECQLLLHLNEKGNSTSAEIILEVNEIENNQINECLDDLAQFRILSLVEAIGMTMCGLRKGNKQLDENM